tara:strand:+ start:7631 stop:8830 length:1200 start_codon:yes stop_codon:yes gene_type:complete
MNFIKKLLHKIFLVLLIIFFPILLFLKKRNFIFVEIFTERIGHLATAIEPLIKKIELNNSKKEKKKYLIFYEKNTNNNFLFKISKRELQKLPNVYFLKGYFFWKYMNLSYEFFTKRVDLRMKTGGRENYHLFSNSNQIIKLTKNEINDGKNEIKKFGMNLNSKWICIHNRDASYLNTIYPEKNWNYHNYRNFSINDLKPAAQYFAEKGYYVFRMGKYSKEKLKTDNPKIIDYSNSKLQSDFMDIFLLSNCEFYFGSPSGIVNTLLLFRKPLFVVNMIPLEAIFSYKRREPCIFMRLLDEKNNKILSIREMVKKNTLFLFNESDYINNKIKPINNSKEEILEFAKEAEKRVNDCWFKSEDQDFKNLSDIFNQEISKDYKVKKMFYDNPIGYDFLKKTAIF